MKILIVMCLGVSTALGDTRAGTWCVIVDSLPVQKGWKDFFVKLTSRVDFGVNIFQRITLKFGDRS